MEDVLARRLVHGVAELYRVNANGTLALRVVAGRLSTSQLQKCCRVEFFYLLFLLLRERLFPRVLDMSS